MTFGELLLEYRAAAGLSQAQLSRRSGISVRALRDLEHGRAQAAQQRSAEALAEALGLSGPERARFLAVAKEGRRRNPRTSPARALCALPVPLRNLVGRDEELDRIRARARVRGEAVAIIGQPGVGKTALAVTAAHSVAADFPDGCFAIDLRGMDDQPVTPRAALDRLLRALGVPAAQIPPTEAEQSGLFRLLLEHRRALLLLDNAADEAQVRPLLVTAPGCLTLITCRRALAGLESARWIPLESLGESGGVELLSMIIGADRVAAEPQAARELVRFCGNLPLAVRIAGNRLATRSHWSLAHLVTLMRDEGTRLSSLSAGDLELRSAFEVSYRRLSPSARRVFRWLTTLPGVDFGSGLAAVAGGLPEEEVGTCLDELVDAGLLQATLPPGRYQFHDLIKLYAVERWQAEEEAGERARRYHRVLDHLLATATAAGLAFFPEETATGPFASRDEAAEWLSREESHWVAAQRAAAALGHHRAVAELAKGMHWYSDTQWMQGPWDRIFALGVDAARALDSKPDLALLLNFLGWAQHICLGDNETGLVTHQQALAVATEIGDRREQAWAHGYLGSVLMRLGRLSEALEHTAKAVELSREFRFWEMQLSVRARLGRVLRALGRYSEALAVHQQLREEAEKHGDEAPAESRRWMMATVTLDIGRTLREQGEHQEAALMFHDARLAFAEGGMRGLMAEALLSEGKALREAGEYAQAREALRYAIAEFRDVVFQEWRDEVRAELARLPADYQSDRK